jgi:hypothetical protein
MRSIYLMLAFVGLFTSITFSSLAQSNLVDVVYLKNGSILRGIVVEQVPGQAIKLQTGDGNLFVFEMEEILKMTREAATAVSAPRPDVQNTPSAPNNAAKGANDGKPRDEWGNTYEQNMEKFRSNRDAGIGLLTTGGVLFVGGGVLIGLSTDSRYNDENRAWKLVIGIVSSALGTGMIIPGAIALSKSGKYKNRARNMKDGTALLSPSLIGTQQFHGAQVRSGSAVGLTLTYRF